MNGHEYILTRQIQWAKNRGIHLTGSANDRGRQAYTAQLDDNLFQPLLPDVREAFSSGDGKELGSPGLPGKMQAVHSSSVLGVNVFQYWKAIQSAPVIAAACGLCREGSAVSCDIRFEEKYPIHDSLTPSPNIDVVIHNTPEAAIRCFAIECKFTEAYGARPHGGMKEKYFAIPGLWDDLPALHQLAQSISPQDTLYRYLHPAQLIKHILGLKRPYSRKGFRLLYLWYDTLGNEGKCHRQEVEQFTIIAKQDGIQFHALTYQELIARLANRLRDDHEAYIRYLTERYL